MMPFDTASLPEFRFLDGCSFFGLCFSGNNVHLVVFLGSVDFAISFVASETWVSILGMAVLAKLLVTSAGVRVGDNIVASQHLLQYQGFFSLILNIVASLVNRTRWFIRCLVRNLADEIMPPTMMTRSAGRPTVASRGGGMGGRAGSGGGRTRGHSGDQGDGRDDGLGGQVGGQGSEVNGGVDGVPDFSTIIAQQLHNLLPYKEFLACNPKKYDGKGGAIVYTRWIEKMESVHDMSGCRDSQRVKYTTGSFVGKALTWWNSKIRTRGREAAIGMSWEDFKTLNRKEFCPSNEMQNLETELWNHVMVGAGHAAYTDMFHEFARLVPHLVTP
ncbi:reverse transcriptase domain-containing protein [Tanacetum coccineum]